MAKFNPNQKCRVVVEIQSDKVAIHVRSTQLGEVMCAVIPLPEGCTVGLGSFDIENVPTNIVEVAQNAVAMMSSAQNDPYTNPHHPDYQHFAGPKGMTVEPEKELVQGTPTAEPAVANYKPAKEEAVESKKAAKEEKAKDDEPKRSGKPDAKVAQ